MNRGLAREHHPSRQRRGHGHVPRVGRPRSAEAHSRILQAAVELVREIGYDALSMEGVAARAGVGKATLYRRWKTKETLLAEAVERIVSSLELPDTGSTRNDLLAVLRSERSLYQDPATLGLLSGLVAAMARSALIARTVREGFVAARRRAIEQVLARAVARGDLRRGLDRDLALDLLAGPLFLRHLFTGGALDDRLLRGVVEAVLHGLRSRR
jgi:AcrR family transcriptional regulator